MLHGRWAFQCRRQLDADPELCDVPVIASRRELMVVGDSIDNTKHAERMLQGLLERNPRNRMAFEYLMAHYLLTRQPAISPVSTSWAIPACRGIAKKPY